MKKTISVFSIIAFGCLTSAYAQKKDDNLKLWEEAQARMIVPEIRTFVTPQICDMQMLNTERQTFGPYYFQIKSIEDTFNYELSNFQSRALYRAVQESDADAVIEPLFNSYVYEKDSKILIVELSGYPVRYTNFRPASTAEVQMIGVIYPDSRTSVSVNTTNETKENVKANNK